jgi:hypothetical protein
MRWTDAEILLQRLPQAHGWDRIHDASRRPLGYESECGGAAMRIPKNLNVGDKVILFNISSVISCEYSRLTVRERRRSDNGGIFYRVEGFLIHMGTPDPHTIKIPCNGVVYTQTEYLDVQVIRKKQKRPEVEVSA